MRQLSLLCSSHKTSLFSSAKVPKIFGKRHSKSFEACGGPATATATATKGLPFDDQIAVPCRNAIYGEGHFLCSHIGLKGRLANDHLSESCPSPKVL